MSRIRCLALSALLVGAVAGSASAQVVVAGADFGVFANAIAANNSGRAASEFWDNVSADEAGANTNCNIGFFATGTLSAACLNQSAGSNANQGGFTNYWGDGLGSLDASSFMFSGGSYRLELLGAYSGNSSEVGWFTLSAGGVYSFNPLGAFGSKNINTVVDISTGSANWGFYIRNAFNPQSGGCFSGDYDCSDAIGSFTGSPFQQFAIFTDAGGTLFLVGAEDNALEVLATNSLYHDSDYNDYIISVTAIPEPMTMGLLATGLVGLAGAGFIRRRREPKS